MRKLLGLAGLALAMTGATHAQTPPRASEVLLGLGGYCWEADLGEGATDTHCFSVARNGHLVMDVHKVRSRSGGVMYEGATLYRLEKESGVVRYDYYNSNGDLLTGYAKRDGDRIRFPEKPDQAGDVVWYLGADAYEVRTADAAEPKRKFVKVGPADPGGF
jgi:hypothetical protein